jgi:hypothetical protein
LSQDKSKSEYCDTALRAASHYKDDSYNLGLASAASAGKPQIRFLKARLRMSFKNLIFKMRIAVGALF